MSTTQIPGFWGLGRWETDFASLRKVFLRFQDPGPFGTFGQVYIFWNCRTNFWQYKRFGCSQNIFGKPGERLLSKEIDAKPVLNSDYSIDLKRDFTDL